MRVIHDLKINPEYYAPVALGRKTFEIRKNDRNYKVGDVLVLREWTDEYTGEIVIVRITYLTDYEQKGNNVVLGIRTIPEKEFYEVYLNDSTKSNN